MTFGNSAQIMVRAGIAEPITNDEGMQILREAKAAGLAQTGDNVRSEISYLCNCCGCCCGMMRSIKRFNIYDGIVPSNWLATIDYAKCRGCAVCVKACPVGAIEVVPPRARGCEGIGRLSTRTGAWAVGYVATCAVGMPTGWNNGKPGRTSRPT